MLNLFQHPFRGRLCTAAEKPPCVYILASKPYETLYIGITSHLIERENPHWADLAPSIGLPPMECDGC